MHYIIRQPHLFSFLFFFHAAINNQTRPLTKTLKTASLQISTGYVDPTHTNTHSLSIYRHLGTMMTSCNCKPFLSVIYYKFCPGIAN